MTITADRMAFSTLGAPGEPVDDVLAHARLGGCAGVELRCREGELIAPESDLDGARSIGAALRAGGVSPVCLATYVQLGSPAAEVPHQLERHLELARAVGAPFIRVFGGDPADEHVGRRASERLRSAAAASQETGVRILLETHDAFLTGREVARVLDESENPTAGAIWDVVNPWRAGETPVETLRHLAHRLSHVQIKDAATPDDLRPVLPGTGSIPLDEVLRLLADRDYSGWIALEWESAWYPDALPLDDALAAFRALLARAR
ncbi:MAG: sugar phosphate isomerase/epimerase family protein [Microbacterium sp.]